MKETMGQIIRRLRKEKNLTQEELSELLGVTSQAVSKWENDVGMPDISQVVPIAHVLGVTTDILFGNACVEGDEQVESFIRDVEIRISNKPEDGISRFMHRKSCCEELQSELAIYPNNYKLICCSLSFITYLLWDYTEEQFADEIVDRESEMKAWADEAIRQAHILLNHCTDSEYLNSANRWLVSIYRIMKDYSKAEEHSMKLTDNRCRYLAVVYSDMGKVDEAMKQYSLNINAALMNLSQDLSLLGHLYQKQQRYEDAYACYRLFPNIYELIFGQIENEVPYYINHPCYDWCAAMCIHLERYDEAMEWLEKWINQERINEKAFNVITRSDLPYFYGMEFSYSYNATYPKHNRITASLEWESFDPIRELDRFKNIVKQAEAFEKE